MNQQLTDLELTTRALAARVAVLEWEIKKLTGNLTALIERAERATSEIRNKQ